MLYVNLCGHASMYALIHIANDFHVGNMLVTINKIVDALFEPLMTYLVPMNKPDTS